MPPRQVVACIRENSLGRTWLDSRFMGCSPSVTFLVVLIGCEYVHPTLNAPLKQWEGNGGYRFSNLTEGRAG